MYRNFRWQHNYGYNSRRYCNPQQHNRKPSLNLNHIHNTHSHNNHTYMVNSHRNSISTPYVQNNQTQGVNQSSLRVVHTTEKRPSLQESTSLQVRRNVSHLNLFNLLHPISHFENVFPFIHITASIFLLCSSYKNRCNVRIAHRGTSSLASPVMRAERRSQRSIPASNLSA